jgi:integrase
VRKIKGEATPLSRQLDQAAAIRALWCVVALTGQRVVQLLAAVEEEAEVPGKAKGRKPTKQRLIVLTDSKGRGAKPKRHAVPLTPRLIDLWQSAQNAKSSDTFTVRGAASRALRKLAPGSVPMDLRRTVETALKDLGVSREDRAELLSHGRSGVQAAHYERTDYIEPKLKALAALERWVVAA